MTKFNYRINIVEIFLSRILWHDYQHFLQGKNSPSYERCFICLFLWVLFKGIYHQSAILQLYHRTYWKRKTVNKYIYILWKCFYSLVPIFVVSTKCIDPWVLEFVVSNITGNNQWENCILFDFNFRGLSGPRNPQKLEPHD